MSAGRQRIRAGAQRVIGVPDASELSTALGALRDATGDLHARIEELTAALGAEAEERERLSEDLAALRAVVIEQTAVIEQLQSRLTAGPGR